MKDYLLNYIRENFKTIKTLLICFLIGIFLGIMIYQFLDTGIKEELINSIKSTFDLAKTQGFERNKYFKKWYYFKYINFNSYIYFCCYIICTIWNMYIKHIKRGFYWNIYIYII